MKINTNNHDKLNAVISAVEKRCRARCITAENVQSMITSVEKQLITRLYKKDWAGIKFYLDYNAQSFPNAYKGIPESTQVLIERGATSWFATVIERSVCDSMMINPLNLGLKKEQLSDFIQDRKNWNV